MNQHIDAQMVPLWLKDPLSFVPLSLYMFCGLVCEIVRKYILFDAIHA